MHYLDLQIQTKGQQEQMHFFVTDMGSEQVLLGYPWLATSKPKFNWGWLQKKSYLSFIDDTTTI